MSSLEAIREFIIRDLHWDGPAEQLTGDYPLIDNHVLDSLGLFALVSYLEDRFGVRIADEDLVPDNFRTLHTIEQLIVRKRATT